ncbi:MAG: type II secretion system F family protein, partial [Acidobacteria bacterium]|nr:type II secretion system F family protein [Acidobacteriota bacterium]
KLGERLNRLIAEADVDWTAGRVALVSATLFMASMAILSRLDFVPWLAAVVVASTLAFAPVAYLRSVRAKRLKQVEEQLPEALEFISRALVAGHSLPMALELLADEIGPPLNQELRKTVDEYNLGLSMEQALDNLADRVPSVDIRFFASAIMTQSRTGGNLHDLLENLSETIRERATLRGQVRAMTANGRITAIILAALPFIIGGIMMVVNAEYFQILLNHPIGKTLLFLALCGQVLAFLVIQKIVDIKV